jgi:polar amino acid transport system substrate-binding protein
VRALPSPRAALALALTLLAGVASAGCGNATGSKAAGTFTPRTPGVLTVATEQVPAAGFWEGTPQHLTGGFAYELARHLATRFGLDRVRVRVIPFDRIVAGQLGGADLAMSLITPTAKRDEVLDFSAPYLDAAPTILVRSGTGVPDLKTARELRWGVQQGTTLVSTTQNAIDPDAPIRFYGDQNALLSALRSGQVDAALFDLPAAVAFAKQSGGRLEVAAQLPESETIAAALPQGSDNLEAVDSAMRALTSDGTVKDLLEQWVGPDAADPEQNVPLLHTTRN